MSTQSLIDASADAARVPCNGCLEIWLQRVIRAAVPDLPFDSAEPLCQIVQGRSAQLWNKAWTDSSQLLEALEARRIVVADPGTADPLIRPEELKLFKQRALSYWGLVRAQPGKSAAALLRGKLAAGPGQLHGRHNMCFPPLVSISSPYEIMTIWFVSRHPGALRWMQNHGPAFDRHVPHLDANCIRAGDVVMGTLPLNLAAEVCARGAQYWHLSLQLPPGLRGRELDAAQLQQLGASLQRFEVQSISGKKT